MRRGGGLGPRPSSTPEGARCRATCTRWPGGVGDRARGGGVVHDQPVPALLLVGVAGRGGAARRSDQPWGALVPALRVARRRHRRGPGGVPGLFGGGYPGTGACSTCPRSRCPTWSPGITLLGPVTREALLAGLYDGLRLATIVICVGAANSLANPKRLLRSVPPALYEIGTALVVAVTVLPQFAESVRRVRAAQTLRAGETGRVRAAAPVPGAGARGRARAVAGAGRRDGHPRLRPRPAAPHRAERRHHRRADAGRPGRRLRRRVRRPGPDRAAVPGRCRCWWSAWRWRPPGFVSAGRRVAAHPLPARPVALARVRRGRVRGRGRRWSAGGSAATSCRSPTPPLGRCPRSAWSRCSAPSVGVLAAAGRRPPARADAWRCRHDRAARHHASGTTTAPVLADVDLTVDEGELVLVSGPTGVGKSTLLGVVTGLVPRFTGGTLAGDVLLDGAQHRRDAAAGARARDRVRRPGPGRRVRHRHRRGGARLRHGAARPAAGHDAPPGRGDARPARHRRPARPRPAHALGRRAAAGGDRRRCSPCTRGCWCSTSRPPRSTRPPPRRCSPR